MENTNDKKQLTFPQRNWLLLCLIVAILSPLAVHLVQGAAREKVYDQAIHPAPTASDTSYKMSASPGDSAKGGAGATPGGTGTSPGGAAPGGAKGAGDSSAKGAPGALGGKK